MKQNSAEKSAALYMRLSREDGDKNESSSIENQRKFLRNYAADNGFTVLDEYIDDGFSGTNFERPAFIRMQRDIILGKVGVVITKDFSRLGRNTGKVMTILDDFFTSKGVRYIAATEGIDTGNKDTAGMLAPILSFTSEFYAGDISRKINAAFAAKMQNGEYIGAFAPFGFKKDPQNKNHLIEDEEAAEIVKRVFNLAKNGYSPKQIANILNSEKTPTPSQYRCKTRGHPDGSDFKTTECWNNNMVARLLRNEYYIGNTVQGKTHKPSFKLNYTESIPKEKWIVVKNTHKALIDYETYNIVRKRMQSKAKKRESGFTNIFSGIAKCKDCGRNMSSAVSRKKEHPRRLTCGAYKQSGPLICSSHSICYDALLEIVIKALKKQINLSADEKESLIKEITDSTAFYAKKLIDVKSKYSAVQNRLTMLYDKKFLNEIDNESFNALKVKYEREKAMLLRTILFEEKLLARKPDSLCPDKIRQLVSDYEQIIFTGNSFILSLIERIDIYEAAKEGKGKRQQIDIYFKFFAQEEELIITE